jgi:hypothetical protein
MEHMEHFERADVLELLRLYLPLLNRLRANDVPYCVVGGIGVMIHSLACGYTAFRGTTDLDLMLPLDYPNSSFSEEYLEAYASRPELREPVYRAVFGDSPLEEVWRGGEFDNASIVGAEESLDGVRSPNVDVLRRLDEETLDTLDFVSLPVLDASICVATVECLLRMKRYTVNLLTRTYRRDPRPQDLVDIQRLEELSWKCG